jgi:vacuolar protein sorting-associated protein 13A/C
MIDVSPWMYIERSLTRSIAYGVLFIKYASVLLQALTVQLDEDFLMEVIDLTKIKGAWEEHSVE